ncbi:hypothetical protein MACJ_002735 [Theileria orientalis]|uniref:CBF1-interacting co-repressor CIR N-terminal domain-containing protein n=1 Tax=Theileria orientalis TaxID=68886 RepID=A0A976M6Q1_THEOR|nr:hypothetical protein MACJ_002735 [Theileria orientalis]
MGGHGGLNILPQKKWNVYRHDRQYQVKFDEHRDIEKKLKEKELKKRESLSDSLVELRRRAQDVRNRDVEVEHTVKKRKSSSHKHNRSKISDEKESDDDNKPSETVSKPPEKKSTGHINFFEKEEREAEELKNKRREHLIKSGHYIYNKDSRGPQKINVFVDDENAKVTPDFKKQPVPWYMKPKSDVSYYSEKEFKENGSLDVLARESKKYRKSKEELRNERLSRESSERERALALLKSK